MASKTDSFVDPEPVESEPVEVVDDGKVDAEFKDVTFFNPHAGLNGRDGGPYLDQVERYAAETLRARAEKREPNYETATFTVGTPAHTKSQMRGVQDVLSHPSMMSAGHEDSTNDGTEVLPVNVNVTDLLNDSSAAGHFVKNGEDASTKDATVLSPLRKS